MQLLAYVAIAVALLAFVGVGIRAARWHRRSVRPRGRSASLWIDSRAQSGARGTAATGAGIVASIGLVGLVEQYLLGGSLYATSLEIIGGIQSLGSNITAPFTAFGEGISGIISAVFPARVINGAADFTLYSLTQGEWSVFGPLTFPVAVGVVLLGLWVFLAWARRTSLSPLQLWRDR